jgi:hypothetical protein
MATTKQKSITDKLKMKSKESKQTTRVKDLATKEDQRRGDKNKKEKK